MKRGIRTVVMTGLVPTVIALAGVGGCTSNPNKIEPFASEPLGASVSRSGLLTYIPDQVPPGHTGWVLVSGAPNENIQVDVSAFQQQAQIFKGKNVTITGKVVERDSPGAAPMRVLAASNIDTAHDQGEQFPALRPPPTIIGNNFPN